MSAELITAIVAFLTALVPVLRELRKWLRTRRLEAEAKAPPAPGDTDA